MIKKNSLIYLQEKLDLADDIPGSWFTGIVPVG